MPAAGRAPARVALLKGHLKPEDCSFTSVAAAACLAVPALELLAKGVTWANAGPKDLHEQIDTTPKLGHRVAVIGIAISGVQAMKSCLAEGCEPTGFEADDDIGGLWRYKDDPNFPSVYRSTHIDSDRDVNTFGDFPWNTDRPQLIHNSQLTEYLRENVAEFDLKRRIKFNARVTLVTPVGEHETQSLGEHKWEVHFRLTDPTTAQVTEHMELFDAVLVCTGRHGGGGFVPQYPNQDEP